MTEDLDPKEIEFNVIAGDAATYTATVEAKPVLAGDPADYMATVEDESETTQV